MTAEVRAQLGIERSYRSASQRTAELFPPRPRPQGSLTRAASFRLAIWFVVFFELGIWPILVVFAGASLLVLLTFVCLAPVNLAISEHNWRRARRLYLAPFEADPGRIHQLETWQRTFNEKLVEEGDFATAETYADLAVSELRQPKPPPKTVVPSMDVRMTPPGRLTAHRKAERAAFSLIPDIADKGYESWCNACGSQTEVFRVTYDGGAAALCPSCALSLVTAWKRIVLLNGMSADARHVHLKALLSVFGTLSAPKARYTSDAAKVITEGRQLLPRAEIAKIARMYSEPPSGRDEAAYKKYMAAKKSRNSIAKRTTGRR